MRIDGWDEGGGQGGHVTGREKEGKEEGKMRKQVYIW